MKRLFLIVICGVLMMSFTSLEASDSDVAVADTDTQNSGARSVISEAAKSAAGGQSLSR